MLVWRRRCGTVYASEERAGRHSSAGWWQIPDSRFRVGGKLPKLGCLESRFQISANSLALGIRDEFVALHPPLFTPRIPATRFQA